MSVLIFAKGFLCLGHPGKKDCKQNCKAPRYASIGEDSVYGFLLGSMLLAWLIA